MPSGVYKRTRKHNENISKSRTGYEQTEEHKKRISRAKLEWWEKHPEAKERLAEIKREKYKGEGNPMFGKKRLDLSAYNKDQSKKRFGANNPSWQGGVSFEPYGREFNSELKFEIRDRDNFVCQFCGIKENRKAHDIHHIDYIKRNNNKQNLTTVCPDHNKKANYDREKWELCFTILQEIRHLTYPIGGI